MASGIFPRSLGSLMSSRYTTRLVTVLQTMKFHSVQQSVSVFHEMKVEVSLLLRVFLISRSACLSFGWHLSSAMEGHGRMEKKRIVRIRQNKYCNDIVKSVSLVRCV